MTTVVWNPLEAHWDAPLAPALFNTPKDCNEGTLVFNWQREHFSAQVFECRAPEVFADLTWWPDLHIATAPVYPKTYVGYILTGKSSLSGGHHGSIGGHGCLSLCVGVYDPPHEPPAEQPAPVPLPAGFGLLFVALLLLRVR